MKKISETIDELIEKYVVEVLSASKDMPEIQDFLNTDNIGEVIEKLIILHIRTWMLEDATTIETDPIIVGELKKKSDICFKQKRPLFVEVINRMIDNSIINGKQLYEDSVKFYGGKNEKR